MKNFRNCGYSCFLIIILFLAGCRFFGNDTSYIEISESVLKDKIRGGILGQFFGNLNGLQHENKYLDKQGEVSVYVPDLSEGAITDDDTDIEFVYIYHMLKHGRIILPYDTIYKLWKENISDRIWCSNRYARNLMEIGIEPPYTGHIILNPWAEFNISGQFLSEQFGLISPGMPRTAARIGIHYTHVAIDGEPTQTTQLYDAMIASAFFEKDIAAVIHAGLASVDPGSEIHKIVSNVLKWYNEHPDVWRKTRLAIKETYWSGEFGGAGGTNGYRVITAATIASLLHGKGDLVESLRLAFNIGWDADNVAAMTGTIVGVMKGEKWIRSQGWLIKDLYTNDRRPGLPHEMTITEFADMHLQLAEQNILEQKGEMVEKSGEEIYRIRMEQPAVIESLPNSLNRYSEMKSEWLPRIRAGLSGDSLEQKQSVYLAICLGIVNEVCEERMEQWNKAIQVFTPEYDLFFNDGNWSPAARKYFYDVVKKGNINTTAPFEYSAPPITD